MNHFKFYLTNVGLFFSTLAYCGLSHAQGIHHQLSVEIDPKGSLIEATDEVTLDAQLCQSTRKLSFLLHEGLSPVSADKNSVIKKIGVHSRGVSVEEFEVSLQGATCSFAIEYKGQIAHPVQGEFSPGTISEEGIFLAGPTYWYPVLGNQLKSFELKATISSSASTKWKVVSQGGLVSSSVSPSSSTYLWSEKLPQDDIYLMAGKFHHYTDHSGPVLAEVYLRQPNPALAKRFLALTNSYIDMYNRLLGAYPYSKFALIENFWETGYGMPSFTVLGPTVIKLPFIGYTSYPHEILHNWWGNGVYIDYAGGNWAEGLTTYLADHYLQEQRGQGANYRRTALANFASYVNSSNDMPLTDFIQRHDKASQAIGYGKSAMFFHMLRTKVGDAAFFKSLQMFYKDHLFKRAGYEDIKTSFEKATGLKDLTKFFKDWMTRKGAPGLKLENVLVDSVKGDYELTFDVTQTQQAAAFPMSIPYELVLENNKVKKGILHQSTKSKKWHLSLTEKPSRLVIDPKFDVFRSLYSEEIPSSLATVFGESKTLWIVLPSKSSQKKKYQEIVAKIKNYVSSAQIKVVSDDQLSVLPSTGSVWILGWQSRFEKDIAGLFKQYGATFSKKEVVFAKAKAQKVDRALFVSLKPDPKQGRTIIWSGINSKTNVSILMRKIFHYGKYSYVGFDDGGTNKLKGVWSNLASPLSKEITLGP